LLVKGNLADVKSARGTRRSRTSRNISYLFRALKLFYVVNNFDFLFVVLSPVFPIARVRFSSEKFELPKKTLSPFVGTVSNYNKLIVVKETNVGAIP